MVRINILVDANWRWQNAVIANYRAKLIDQWGQGDNWGISYFGWVFQKFVL